nr:cytochrome C [Desulfobacterales bacterium]
MTSKKELLLALILTLVLLVVGVISYAAFPAKAPDQPVRLMFKGVAGKVLFTHKMHT